VEFSKNVPTPAAAKYADLTRSINSPERNNAKGRITTTYGYTVDLGPNRRTTRTFIKNIPSPYRAGLSTTHFLELIRYAKMPNKTKPATDTTGVI